MPSFVHWIPALTYLVSLALGLAGVALPGGSAGLEPLAQWMLFLGLGLQSLWNFTGHVFAAEEVARSIGWETSPFQFEVGLANLGIGAGAILAAFLGPDAAWAMVAVSGGFLWGAAWGHVREMRTERNFAINNCGPIFWWDLLTPATVAAALAM